MPINSPSLASKVTIASQLDRLPLSSTNCPFTVAYDRPSAGTRDSNVLICSLTGAPRTLKLTEAASVVEPIALTVIWLSPACSGTPYHVCVTVLAASFSSDRPIKLASTAFPFTNTSILVSMGIWITNVAAGASNTVLAVGERMMIFGAACGSAFWIWRSLVFKSFLVSVTNSALTDVVVSKSKICGNSKIPNLKLNLTKEAEVFLITLHLHFVWY